MQTYTPTPDFYNDYIQHFNPNHDPRNGQFTTGLGGGFSIRNKVRAMTVADSNQDMFNDVLYRAKYSTTKKDKKQAIKEFKNLVKDVSKDFKVPHNIVERQAKKSFEYREKFIGDMKNNKKQRRKRQTQRQVQEQNRQFQEQAIRNTMLGVYGLPFA